MYHAFVDRLEAGRSLAEAVSRLNLAEPVVLALPRGGVPVAAEVARALNAPLDLLMVRKIGAPYQSELAIGAVANGPTRQLIVDPQMVALTGADQAYVDRVAAEQLREIERRRAIYMAGRAPVALAGRSVVVVDDGIATGSTMRAALAAVRRSNPARLVLAVPVAPPDTVHALRSLVDDLVCLAQPEPFRAVGLHYRDFPQVGDEEVVQLLREFGAPGAPDA